MPAVPKKRVTKSKQGKRSSHFHMDPISVSRCPQCNSPKLPHRVCPTCGSYKGREVIQVGTKTKEQER